MFNGVLVTALISYSLPLRDSKVDSIKLYTGECGSECGKDINLENSWDEEECLVLENLVLPFPWD